MRPLAATSDGRTLVVGGGRRPAVTSLIVVAMVLAALVVGGIGGYILKSLASPPLAGNARASAVQAPAGSGPSTYRYVQGGRPASVYGLIAPAPSVYEQGGRPPVVYSDAAH